MIVYIKHTYYYLVYLIEKYLLRKEDLKVPVMLNLPEHIIDYIYTESSKKEMPTDDFINLILKEVINEIENK